MTNSDNLVLPDLAVYVDDDTRHEALVPGQGVGKAITVALSSFYGMGR
jgi:hypothetical protein